MQIFVNFRQHLQPSNRHALLECSVDPRENERNKKRIDRILSFSFLPLPRTLSNYQPTIVQGKWLMTNAGILIRGGIMIRAGSHLRIKIRSNGIAINGGHVSPQFLRASTNPHTSAESNSRRGVARPEISPRVLDLGGPRDCMSKSGLHNAWVTGQRFSCLSSNGCQTRVSGERERKHYGYVSFAVYFSFYVRMEFPATNLLHVTDDSNEI